MAKWGVICLVCDRLLWTMDKPFQKGEALSTERKGLRHGKTGRRPAPGDVVQWCLCKGGLGQQELAETGNDNLDGSAE